jgi:hypothetical protein
MQALILRILFFFCLCFLVSANHLQAQSGKADSTLDINDLYRIISKKKGPLIPDSIVKRKLGPFYTIIPYPGYAMVTGFLVGLTNNLAFYTHAGEDARISNIQMNNVYSQYNQYINIINSTIWLSHERFNLVGDWRFYQFPTNTFGLGSKTKLSDAIPVDYSELKIDEVLLAKLAMNFSGGVGYNYNNHWNISETKASPASMTDIDRYGFSSQSVSSGFTINLQYDNRLNSNHPTNGAYVYFQYGDNLKALGSSGTWQSVLLDARYYINTSKKTGNVLALWSYNWLTLSGNPPYFDLPATGTDTYDNTARAYVEGRYRGLNLIYTEAEYRFRWMKSDLLGGVVFLNASTFTEYPDNRFEKINPGTGAGLRIKMNKKSNTNLCVDYGIGTGGSRGFAFNLNEVF